LLCLADRSAFVAAGASFSVALVMGAQYAFEAVDKFAWFASEPNQ
jgi:hypothetical protein